MRWRGCLIPRSPRPRAQAPPPSFDAVSHRWTATPSGCPHVPFCFAVHLSFFPSLSTLPFLVLFSLVSSSFFLHRSRVGSFSFLPVSLDLLRRRFIFFSLPLFGPPNSMGSCNRIMENRQPPNRSESGKKNHNENTTLKTSFISYCTLLSMRTSPAETD